MNMPNIEKFLMRNGEANNMIVALITYFVDKKQLCIEPIKPKVKDDLVKYPYVLQQAILRGYKQLPQKWSDLWLDERVVPAGRPGVIEKLATYGIYEYNAVEIMKIVEGRNAMDGTYWEPVDNKITVDDLQL